MRENKLPNQEGAKVIPFQERMELEFNILVRKYLPDNPNLADLTVGTIKYLKDEGYMANDKSKQVEITNIISEFQQRFLQKFPQFDNTEKLADKQKEKEKSANSYDDYSASLGGQNKPSKPEVSGIFSEKKMKELIENSKRTGLRHPDDYNDADNK